MTQQLFDCTKEVVVRAIHHLENTHLSPEENKALYGLCYGKHGHHYKIRVTLRGPLDEVTGMVFDRDRFERILEAAVLEPLDGSDLNEIFPNTAGEALARALFLRLKPLFPAALLHKIGIQETPKNYFEFTDPGAGTGPEA